MTPTRLPTNIPSRPRSPGYWSRGAAVVCAAALLAAASCGDSVESPRGAACARDPVTDLDREPEFTAEYLDRWNKGECPVRLDVLMTRSGPDFCGGGIAQLVVALPPPGGDPGPPLVYVRDPDGVLGEDQLTRRLDLDADLPRSAVASPYTQDGVRMWRVPEDDAYVYLVSGDGKVERWPLDDVGIGCD